MKNIGTLLQYYNKLIINIINVLSLTSNFVIIIRKGDG